MSHVSSEAVAALFALTEIKATDDAIICVSFTDELDAIGDAVIIKNEDGTSLTLGQLRELAAAFGAWL